MIQLANFEERTFYVMLGKVVTSVDVTFVFQMTEEEFNATLIPVSSSLRATKFTFQATSYPEGQYIVKFVETGQTEVLATIAGFVSGNPIFATSQYNTYNDDGTSTTYVPSDDQGLVPSVSQKLRVSTVNQSTDVSYVRYIKVTNGALTDNGDNSVTIATGGAEFLVDLNDVLITGFPANNILRYDAISAKWKNVVLDLAALSDTKGTPTEGKFLKYTGGFWQPADVSAAFSLGQLTDVTTDGQQSGYVLVSDGTTWSAAVLPIINGVNTTRSVVAGGGFTKIDLNDDINLTSVTADSITIEGEYTLPLADGTANQLVKTDGAGTLTFGANLQDLDNVAPLTPSAGQVLTFVNSEWQPASPASPPPAPVTSVNTQTGAVVLDTDDVSQGATNLYYTDALVSANTSVVANTAKRSYPVADENKLAGIAAGAEVNVNSDWNATSGDAQILNKPTIPTNTNLANTDLTLNDTRVHDIDGNSLEFNTNGGDFFIKDGASTRLEISPQELQIEGLTYPATDGTNGQVLTTNGAGSLSFTTVSGGGGGNLGSSDQTLTGDRLIDTNGYNLAIELDPTGTADTFTIHDGTHDLFQVDTNTTGSLFSVNDVSGLPMFQSNSDGTMALPQILTAAPTGTAPEGTMQLGIVSGTCRLYVYINGGWKSTTLS